MLLCLCDLNKVINGYAKNAFFVAFLFTPRAKPSSRCSTQLDKAAFRKSAMRRDLFQSDVRLPLTSQRSTILDRAQT